jgi:deoxyribonuclease IV
MPFPFLFGTVGSPISTPKKPGGTIGAIQQISSLGLGALELGWVQSVRVSEETCLAIRETANKFNIKLSVHAPYFINLNADDEEWPKSRKRLMDAAYYGSLAGATDIIFHPGSYFSRLPEEVLKIATIRLRECVLELKENNILVNLRPETMGKSAMLGSLEDTLSLSQAIPGVIPCLDFAHLHARPGNGSMNSYQEWLSVIDQYSKFLSDVSLKSLHIHLSGIEYSEKGERNHLPLKESDLHLHELFTALHDKHCAGRILCESPILEEDALYMKKVWEEISGETAAAVPS